MRWAISIIRGGDIETTVTIGGERFVVENTDAIPAWVLRAEAAGLGKVIGIVGREAEKLVEAAPAAVAYHYETLSALGAADDSVDATEIDGDIGTSSSALKTRRTCGRCGRIVIDGGRYRYNNARWCKKQARIGGRWITYSGNSLELCR